MYLNLKHWINNKRYGYTAEISMDEIKSMCDELIDAYGDWLPNTTY